jgi:hypothetical protein
MIRAMPRRRVRADDGVSVSFAERWSNIVRIFFTPPHKWPKSDRHTAVGWQPDETWTEDLGETAGGQREWFKKIER